MQTIDNPRRTKRILVVEDQPDNRQIIRDMLAPPTTKSWRLKTASRRWRQSQSSSRSHFDGYPIADHGRLYRHAPNQSRSCNAIDPNHCVTSYALSGEEKKARAAGCDDYVPKPFSPRQLLAKIRQYLS
jgi:two-component system, cell cycle response regulator DivK